MGCIDGYLTSITPMESSLGAPDANGRKDRRVLGYEPRIVVRIFGSVTSRVCADRNVELGLRQLFVLDTLSFSRPKTHLVSLPCLALHR